VFRGLLTPRWVGLTIVMLIAVVACVFLGLWQLGVAQDEGRKEAVSAAAALPRAPLSEVAAPHSAFQAEFSNRPVSVTGTYAAELGFVVPDRRLGGRVGSWVVTPLKTPAGTVAVLRGFVDGTPTTLSPLVNDWPGDLYNVVLLASSESGHADPALARVPPPEADAPLNFKNLAYAIQWWVFGLFAIWMWWKMFRAEQQPADPEPAAPREDAHA